MSNSELDLLNQDVENVDNFDNENNQCIDCKYYIFGNNFHSKCIDCNNGSNFNKKKEVKTFYV